MEFWHKMTSNKSLVIVFSALFALQVLAVIQDDLMLDRIAKIVVIPVLLTLYFTRMKYMANIFLTVFLCSFLGDVFTVFHKNELTHQLSEMAYVGSYILLLGVLISQFRKVRFEGVVSVYLGLIFMFNAYLLYILYGAVKNSFVDDISLWLYAGRGLAIVLLVFLAFALYLSRESKQSIILLVTVACFAFGDVLKYICELYVYFWVFEVFAIALHLAALVFLLAYVSNHHRKAVRYSVNKESLSSTSSEHATV
ncbi:hypothetical protein [Mangrovimonas sp. DI 80]|uniref:hypothetical protein n=1 Tax=Mangrovimonas sp. DI 80 TaxID=1779330 RepID=UPI00097899FD|nr:hypothetical protein [Mangrovimonas sp. DI 80]OMP29792.1 hypothetical protein BKM32_15985 [Mangrovimonas sp. DI 80]